ncbi:SIL1 [Cucumis melo var. makuwa]|uniref:SIL1 n=1 Tax=Cucumis melo var. makuwa TaxID=1194695 RepID=A0A5D3DJ76_CUCMM|nr:SIL1 [Cucumis melo var. makuwa]
MVASTVLMVAEKPSIALSIASALSHGQREVHLVIGEFLLRLPLREKGCFLWCVGVCAVIWNLWGERNNRVFRGVEREPCEVWSLVRCLQERVAQRYMNLMGDFLGIMLIIK